MAGPSLAFLYSLQSHCSYPNTNDVMTTPEATASAPTPDSQKKQNGSNSACPPHVLEAIYGKVDKKAAYEESLRRWEHLDFTHFVA
jgi:hypothetical protein